MTKGGGAVDMRSGAYKRNGNSLFIMESLTA